MMLSINTLYNVDHKLYDYPVGGGKKIHGRIADHIRVYHEDGTFSIGYMYGEKHFTYDEGERAAQRLADKERLAANKIRKGLLAKIEALSTDDLQALVDLLEL